MLRNLIILATFLGIIGIVVNVISDKVTEIGAAQQWSMEYSSGIKAASVITINDCADNGVVDFDPYAIELDRKGGYLNILNKDTKPHTIVIDSTNMKKVLKAGERWEVPAFKFSTKKDKWHIVCDGIEKGEASPKVLLYTADN